MGGIGGWIFFEGEFRGFFKLLLINQTSQIGVNYKYT